MPSSCSNEDIVWFMRIMTGRDEITIDPHKCHVIEATQISNIDIIFGYAYVHGFTKFLFLNMKKLLCLQFYTFKLSIDCCFMYIASYL
jgi:hypothetical protein